MKREVGEFIDGAVTERIASPACSSSSTRGKYPGAAFGQRHAVLPKFFAQFFAGANAGERNLDIAIRLQPGESDEVFGKIKNANLLAHVEHKHLAALAHGRGLQNKMHRFGDGHEITVHVRMRNGDGSAAARFDV